MSAMSGIQFGILIVDRSLPRDHPGSYFDFLIGMADVSDQAIAEGASSSCACSKRPVVTLSIDSVQRCPRRQDRDQLAVSRL